MKVIAVGLAFFFILSNSFAWHMSNYIHRHRSSSLVMHFEEAGTGSTLGLLEAKRYIATNRFNVRANKEAAFEKRWATRKSRLAKLDGFRFFTLLKKQSVIMGGNDENDKDPNYISFTIWENKDNFDEWRTGEAFKEAHGGGGIMDFVQLLSTALFILNGKPNPAFYDGLIPQVSSFSNSDLGIQPNENGWRDFGDLADGEHCLPADVIVVQDKFVVKDDSKSSFEEVWSSRESALKGYSGFVGFLLQRRDALKADDKFNYIATTMWKDMNSFDGFKKAMIENAAQGKGGKSTADMLLQPPKIILYEGKLALLSSAGP